MFIKPTTLDYQDPQSQHPFHWHYSEFDDNNFQIRGTKSPDRSSPFDDSNFHWHYSEYSLLHRRPLRNHSLNHFRRFLRALGVPVPSPSGSVRPRVAARLGGTSAVRHQ
nr:RING-H2 finger protein ATL66 [Ipomoea trifida]